MQAIDARLAAIAANDTYALGHATEGVTPTYQPSDPRQAPKALDYILLSAGLRSSVAEVEVDAAIQCGSTHFAMSALIPQASANARMPRRKVGPPQMGGVEANNRGAIPPCATTIILALAAGRRAGHLPRGQSKRGSLSEAKNPDRRCGEGPSRPGSQDKHGAATQNQPESAHGNKEACEHVAGERKPHEGYSEGTGATRRLADSRSTGFQCPRVAGEE